MNKSEEKNNIKNLNNKTVIKESNETNKIDKDSKNQENNKIDKMKEYDKIYNQVKWLH